jgi:hypothetical protein
MAGLFSGLFGGGGKHRGKGGKHRRGNVVPSVNLRKKVPGANARQTLNQRGWPQAVNPRRTHLGVRGRLF